VRPPRPAALASPRPAPLSALLAALLAALLSAHAPRAALAASTTELRARYQAVYARAEDALAAGRLLEAIRVYEESLAALEGYGGAHLRLAQLYLRRVEEAADPALAAELSPFVAFHFLRCAQDARLDDLMRDTVCGSEVKRRLSPLLVKGAPVSLEVLAPRPFLGAAAAGALLPLGDVALRAQASPAAEPRELTARLPLREPIDLSEEAFMPARPRLDEGGGLVSGPPPAAPLFAEPPPPRPSRLPPAALLGAGAVAAGVGAYLLREQMVKINANNYAGGYGSAIPSIALTVSGAALTVFGVGWLAQRW